jgi:hypothetical protein
MRIKKRLIVVCALGAVGALAAASSAFAADANSTATFKFCKAGAAGCKTNVGTTLKNGKLNVHTHTNYSVGGTKTDRAQLFFDNQLKFNPNAVPKCAANLAGLNMKQGMAACKNALVGTGKAKANAAAPGDTNACVLVFNTKDANPDVGGDQPGVSLLTRAKIVGTLAQLNNCANPANNETGDVTVLLQAPLTGTTNQNPANVYKNGGKNLLFANIATASAFPLSDFNVWTGVGAPDTKLTGAKAKFIQAKCRKTGPAANRNKWYMRTIFKYTTGTPLSQTVNSPTQKCS